MVISFRAIDYFGMVLFYAPLRMIHESTRRYNELQNAQKQIIHSERMAAKGEMAAEVGHELRNQLAAISGRAQMLLRDAAKGQVENIARHAEIVLEQSKRMESLSKGLMEFSRAELTVERISLNPLVQRSIDSCARRIPRRRRVGVRAGGAVARTARIPAPAAEPVPQRRGRMKERAQRVIRVRTPRPRRAHGRCGW